VRVAHDVVHGAGARLQDPPRRRQRRTLNGTS
jgi:hypothetical protein